jgi:hypothetical protein
VVRYIIEQDVGVKNDRGMHEEDWQPHKSPYDRVHVKSDDGIRIFTEAGKAYKYMNRIRLIGQRFRVKRVELAG